MTLKRTSLNFIRDYEYTFVRRQSTNSTSKKKLQLSGIFPPIVTPFDTKGVICYDRLRKNFDVWNKIPFTGYLVAGSNGEAATLSFQERIDFTKAVRNLAKKDSIILAGTGLVGTSKTIALTNAIAETGAADAALITAPYYYKSQMNDRVLLRHFETIADQSKIPILIYQAPKFTGVDISPEVCIKLADHPNVIGMKYSEENILIMSRILDQTKDKDFKLFGGSAGYLLSILLIGAVGSIPALANILGAEICELYNLVKRGEMDKAIALQLSLLRPNDIVTRKYSIPGVKSAMKLGGMYPGFCRPPLLALELDEVKDVKSVFQKAGFPLENNSKHKCC